MKTAITSAKIDEDTDDDGGDDHDNDDDNDVNDDDVTISNATSIDAKQV